MTLRVSLDDPVGAKATAFTSEHGCVTFRDARGASVEIYTTPAAAKAVADAFNAAMQEDDE